VPPSSPSEQVSWRGRIRPRDVPGQDAPFAWLRYLHEPLALAGLWWIDPSAWPLYLLLTVLLIVEWPFCISLADDVEIYFPVMWTSAAATYIIGPAILPVYWIASFLGFVLIIVLDKRGVIPAVGFAADSAKRFRGEPYRLDSVVDGDLRHFLLVSERAVRAAVFAGTKALGLTIFAGVLVAEAAVQLWLRIVPIPGRMAPVRWRERITAVLGPDMLIASLVLDVSVILVLLFVYQEGGAWAFAGASLLTLALHSVLKRLSETRGELERRQELAVIGQTASTVFHQLGRHHGAIGMYAHLLARGGEGGVAWPPAVGEHARRIIATVDEANRVVDELLAFGQDRTLNLYPQAVGTLIDECLEECRPRAAKRQVALDVTGPADLEATLDKHKIKQALENVLDNAIDAAPPGSRVEVSTAADNGVVRILVRDHGTGVAPDVRDRLFTPFCTTKPDGVGLGLALAKELVDAHGGSITWEAAHPGTVFVLSLPRDAHSA